MLSTTLYTGLETTRSRSGLRDLYECAYLLNIEAAQKSFPIVVVMDSRAGDQTRTRHEVHTYVVQHNSLKFICKVICSPTDRYSQLLVMLKSINPPCSVDQMLETLVMYDPHVSIAAKLLHL
jgi:hypothetical protein